MLDLAITPQDLSELCADIREARFSFLVEESNGLLADTWCEPSGRMCYWPGGELKETFFELCPEEDTLISQFCKTHNCEVLGVGSGRVVLSPEKVILLLKLLGME